jgi:nitroreductase
MELLDAIRSRRSYRFPFRDEPISEEHIGLLLEAARWAPSPFNIQPWEIVLIDDPSVKSEIARLTAKAIKRQFRDPKNLDLVARWTRLTPQEWQDKGDGVLIDEHVNLPAFVDRGKLRPLLDNFKHMSIAGWLGAGRLPARQFASLVRQAPLLMLFLLDREKRSPGENGEVWLLMGMGAIVQNVHLTATALGIGVQYVNAALESPRDRAQLRRIVNAPQRLEPMTLLRMGYTADEKPRSVRRRAEEFTHLNRFGEEAKRSDP